VPIDHQRLQALADSSRATGFLVERLTDVSVPSYTLLAGLTAGNLPDAVVRTFNAIVAAFPDRYYLGNELNGDEPLPVSVIVAPTYTDHGRPDLLLGLFVLRDVVPSEITVLGEAVRQAARTVTRQVGGCDPWTGTGR
jgi:hypothetical protein